LIIVPIAVLPHPIADSHRVSTAKHAVNYACCFFVPASSNSFGQDAWMFRRNPQHTGIYSSAPLAHPGRAKWISSVICVGSTGGNLYALQ
jgi:hypothetical protein